MVGFKTAGIGACRVGVRAATAAAAPTGGPAQAQPKTIAASANASRRLRREVGMEERERRAANHVISQPWPVLKRRRVVRNPRLSTPICLRGIGYTLMESP